jgi:cytochrome c oxidase subunit 3
LSTTTTTAGLTISHHHDYIGSKMGMWLFLFTEILLFGGLFILYAVYRAVHPHDFHVAHARLNVFYGSINTIILITSSLTMALSIETIHRGKKGLSLLFLALTIAFALWFLANKYFEWGAEIHHGIYPNSPTLLEHPKGEILFFGLYYSMTGLHGLHVIVGAIILSVVGVKLLKKPSHSVELDVDQLSQIDGARLAVVDNNGKAVWLGEGIDDTVRSVKVHAKYALVEKRTKKEDFAALEYSGLYWHLVDLIWIFLFPLFYLIT